MTAFAPRTATLPSAPADPGRRVHYTQGLVLGVDELTQEFAYLAGRDRWALRDLAGYGTVSGLRVESLPDDPLMPNDQRGPRVVVSAGAAVSPSGRLIRVGTAQQAVLDQWLDANRVEVSRRADIELGSPPSAWIELFLVLCHRERLTGMKPGPGVPCRSDDETAIASRIADDFALELRFDRPAHREDAEVSRFVALLPQIEVVETGGVLLDEFLDALRLSLMSIDSPPRTVPELLGASPPGAVQVRADDVRDFLRAALRLWITEVRPLAQEHHADAPECTTAEDDCVLLAGVRVPITFGTDGWRADDTLRIAIDETQRPLVAHTRFLQEWMLAATGSGGGGGGVVAAGRVRGTSTLGTRGGLHVAAAPVAGRVKLAFTAYHAPIAGEDWIVRALPTRLSGASDPVILDFGGFDVDGFVLLATRAGAPLSVAELNQLELQVEVSRL